MWASLGAIILSPTCFLLPPHTFPFLPFCLPSLPPFPSNCSHHILTGEEIGQTSLYQACWQVSGSSGVITEMPKAVEAVCQNWSCNLQVFHSINSNGTSTPLDSFFREYYEFASFRMQFLHPLIRTIQKASYSGLVHKEDKLLGGTTACWSWEENWQGVAHGRVLSSCDLHCSL